MSYQDLTKNEQEIVKQCMVAILEGPFIPDWELPIRAGITRSDLRVVIAAWPELDDSDDHSVVTYAIKNSMNEICHGVRITPDEWQMWFTVSKDEVKQTFSKARKTIKSIEEGHRFAVPRVNGGYVAGIVARTSAAILTGYFFGPIRQSQPRPNDFFGLKPFDAIFVARFINPWAEHKAWPLLRPQRNWDRAEWEMRFFGRGDKSTEENFIVEYDDHDPTRVVKTTTASADEVVGLPQDEVLSDIMLQERLTKLLAQTDD
jgi:hypothetical protein